MEEQAPTAQNTYTWYRLYNDGWVEQGGYITAPSASSYDGLYALPITMATNNYYVGKLYDRGANITGGNNWLWLANSVSTVTNTTSAVYISVPSNSYVIGCWWEVKGMAANTPAYNKIQCIRF